MPYFHQKNALFLSVRNPWRGEFNGEVDATEEVGTRAMSDVRIPYWIETGLLLTPGFLRRTGFLFLITSFSSIKYTVHLIYLHPHLLLGLRRSSLLQKFTGKGGRYGNDDCLSPVSFVNSGDTHSDLPEAAELHCCDLFDYRRTSRLDSLALLRGEAEHRAAPSSLSSWKEGGVMWNESPFISHYFPSSRGY